MLSIKKGLNKGRVSLLNGDLLFKQDKLNYVNSLQFNKSYHTNVVSTIKKTYYIIISFLKYF